ncbi:MAG: CDC27 family protein [Sedimentisphaerales bacterium]|nr:CDC27 family protein [Sedimentisphaerales bacterium]MBN2842129.1 CDC27 family protein [Sedimentisphaerales bacterium]
MQSDNIKDQEITLHTRELLEQGKYQEALQYLKKTGKRNHQLDNIRGVCLIRLGQYEEAISVLKEIVFQGNICIPQDTPVSYQINFATAMIMANKKSGAISVLTSLNEKTCPQVCQLKRAIKNWAKGLNFWEKLCYLSGSYPQKPITLDFVPGEL